MATTELISKTGGNAADLQNETTRQLEETTVAHQPLPRHREAPARRTPAAAAVLIMLGFAASAQAIEIDTGSTDRVLRWDNTLRYNLGVRTQSADSAILANPNYDDGDRNFPKGHLVANRLDLLSELDFVVQKQYGFRVSGAGWADIAYTSLSDTNTSNATSNALVNGKPTGGALSPYASRYAKGPSGELLDAFLFANSEIGSVPVSARLGRHTVYWGESLLGSGALHGISYGQYSLDLWKGYATPGVEAKELFRPRDSLTLQAEPTPELSLSAQTFFDWEAVRYPESGTYLTVQDALLRGGQSLIAGPNQRLLQGDPGTPKKTGDFGLAARWSPSWLDGTAGLYLRRTADIQPQLGLVPAVAAGVPAATCSALHLTPLGPTTCYINPTAASIAQIQAGQIGQYRAFYGRDIDILGLSLSKNVAGVSVSGELSYRRNMPLSSVPVQILPAALVNPANGQVSTAAITNDAPGARGDTLHSVLSAIGSVAKTPLFDAASWQAEMVYSRWLKVTQNEAAFKGTDAYRSVAANVDGVTKDYFGLAINFTPTWFQVLPSVDVSMPLTWSGGIAGTSAVLSGGAAGNGTYSLGLSADVQSKYNVALRYVGFYGGYSTTTAGAMNVPQSTTAVLSDRGFVALTLKTTF
jgi:Protein of unknown function (DUF1302)